MTTKDIFEECSLWPLYLSLFNTEIVTLWGDAGLEKDTIINNKDGLLFFQNEKRLVKFILNKNQCNFSNTPGYNKFIGEIKRNGWKCNIEPPHFNYSEIGLLIREFNYLEWNSLDCSKIVNCLNTIMDAGISLNDERICSMFFRQGKKIFLPLAEFTDALTFQTPSDSETFNILLAKSSKKEIYSLFTEALGRICLRSVIL